MKEGKEDNDDMKVVLISKMSATVTGKHKNTKVTKFNWRRNMGKSGHYCDGCYWMGQGWGWVYQYIHVWCTHTRDKNRSVHQKQENRVLHCSYYSWRKQKISTVTPEYRKKSMSTCCSYYSPFQKISHFCWLLLEHWARKGPERGKRKMALITGKRGQWELVVTIAETIQLIFMLYGFLIYF